MYNANKNTDSNKQFYTKLPFSDGLLESLSMASHHYALAPFAPLSAVSCNTLYAGLKSTGRVAIYWALTPTTAE